MRAKSPHCLFFHAGTVILAVCLSVMLSQSTAAQSTTAGKSPKGNSESEKSAPAHQVKKDTVTPPASRVSTKSSKTAAKSTKTPDAQGAKSPEKKDTTPSQADKQEEKKKKAEEREKKRVEWIEKTLEFGIQQDRMDAMGSILKIHNPEDRNRLCEKLRQSLKDEIDIEIKTKAISVLGELKYKNALPEIIQSIDDETQDVKIAAVYAIKRIGEHSAAKKLSEELKKQDLKKQSNYSEALIDALGEFKAIDLKDFAIEEIKKDTVDKNIRQNLIIFLGRIEATDAKDFLLGIAKDDSEDVIARAYAVNSLARMKITDSSAEIDKIIKEIDSYPFKKRQRYYKLYVYSLAALARMGDSKVFPRLENAARSNNEQVRLQAVKLLKEIKGKRTIDILQYRMKYDPSARVQRAARDALEELGVPIEEDKQGANQKSQPKSQKEDFTDRKDRAAPKDDKKEDREEDE